jgi:hypothetical protein
MHDEEQQVCERRAALGLGGACVAAGALAVLGFRLAHGDAPAYDAEAQLRYVADHWGYAVVHLGTVLGVLVWAAGVVALVGTLTDPSARLLGRVGAAAVLVGAAVFAVDFTVDGVAGQDLARAWAAAPPLVQAELVLAARTALTMLRGTSLVAIVVLWGLPLMLLGRALALEGYPAWLGWSGAVIGALTLLGATALLLQPELFPGVLVYGLLASVVVQLWSVGLGVLMRRRGAGAA